jgi:hypothetical protein
VTALARLVERRAAEPDAIEGPDVRRHAEVDLEPGMLPEILPVDLKGPSIMPVKKL